MPAIGRNDPCPCGSGKKYKKCCEEKDQLKEHAALEKRWETAAKTLEKEQEAAASADKANPKIAATPKKADLPKASRPKHNTFMAPKTSMPRRTGGG